MSSVVQFELTVWRDETTVSLDYWDALAGNDILYVLHEDGHVTRNDEQVDLVKELRELALRGELRM